jgi:pimeloyl-ACP methyl ester carboxylesterase
MTATVVALPGFTRTPRHLQFLASACESAGIRCLRPKLTPRWLPLLSMSRRHLRKIAQSVTRQSPGPFVLVGHSAGAAAACFIARLLAEGESTSLHGLVLIDGVDSPNHLIRHSLPFLASTPVAAVLAPPSRCNRNGQLQQMLTSKPWISIDVIDGSGHGDIEGGGVAIYRRICGEESSTETAALQLRAVMHHIERMSGPPSSPGRS